MQLQGRVGGVQEDLQGLRGLSSRRWLPRPEAGAHEGRVTEVGDRRVGEALLCSEHIPPRVLAFSRHERTSGVPGISLRAFHRLSKSLHIFVLSPCDDNFTNFMLKKHVLTGKKLNTMEEVR